jgi:ABC-type glycerol-3-phosphate transport system permease component
MVFARKLELSSGVATAILGLVVPLSLSGMISNMPPEYYRESLIQIIILFVCPGLLVAIGAYAHAVKQRPWGRKLLWVMGALYIIVSPIIFLLGGYGGGLRQAFLVITPSITAIVTLISSLGTGTPNDLR